MAEVLTQGFLVAGFLLARINQFAASQNVSFPDSKSFLDKATRAPLTTDFFFGEGRLFTVPLAWAPWIRIFGANEGGVALLQLLVACAAWLALAFAIARQMQTAGGRVSALVLVLVLGSTSDIAQWDRAMLSESISTSLFAALLAAWLWWGERRCAGDGAARIPAGIVVLIATLWAFARESNGIFLLLLAAVAVLVSLADPRRPSRRRRLQAVAMAAAFATIFSAVQTVADQGERWFFPLLNVIGRRVLPSADRTAFYVEAGMPMSPALAAMRGEFASGRDWAFYRAPELASLRAWVRTDGRRTYLRDLTLHPRRTLSEPLVNARYFICPELLHYRPADFSPAWADNALATFCTSGDGSGIPSVVFVGGALLALFAVLARHRISPRSLFLAETIGALLVAWPIMTWLTWHAIGEMEISRHVLWATFFLRFGVLLAAVWLLDATIAAVAVFAGPRVMRLRQSRRR